MFEYSLICSQTLRFDNANEGENHNHSNSKAHYHLHDCEHSGHGVALGVALTRRRENGELRQRMLKLPARMGLQAGEFGRRREIAIHNADGAGAALFGAC